MAKKNFRFSNKNHRYHRDFAENYGRALYNSGRTEEALPVLKRASKKTKSYWVLKLLGMISYQKGDTLNAVSYLERAVRIPNAQVTRSELVYVYTLLGQMFLQQGQQDGAHRYYQKVLELDPHNREAQQFVKGIQKSYDQNGMMKLIESLGEL